MAIVQCQRIEELAPDYADVTYNLGQLHQLAGHPAEAVPYLRRAVEINPYDVERRIVLASALRETGQNEEAVRQLDRALQIRPDDEAARKLRQASRGDLGP